MYYNTCRKYILKKQRNFLTVFLCFFYVLAKGNQIQDLQAPPAQSVPILLLEAYNHSFNLKFQESYKVLEQVKKLDPNNPYILLIEDNSDFINLLITDDEEHFQRIQQNEKVRLNVLDNQILRKPNSQDLAFVRNEILLHWAFLKLLFGKELSGIWQLRETYKNAVHINKRFPSHLPSLKTLGILQILLGSAPDNYNWVLSTFGVKSSQSEGLKNLQEAVKGNHFQALESKLLLVLAQGYILKNNEEALEGFSAISIKNRQNDLINFLYGSFLLKNGKAKEASELFMDLGNRFSPSVFPLIYYQMANISLMQGLWRQSSIDFQKFLSGYKGLNNLKDSYYKLGCISFLNNTPQAMEANWKKAKAVGRAFTESDKHAYREVKDGILPNRYLLQARWAFDGGYYERCQKLLDSAGKQQITLIDDQIELLYRKGRLAHKLKDTSTAINFYKQTIDKSKQLNLYFGPNAALNLGYIYKNKKDTSTALEYANEVFEFKSHPYSTSIEQKAKALIGSLKN